jgi:long-chain acyl-CoA synthetase
MSSEADTFPKLLLRTAARLGEQTALREKKLGIWQPMSWIRARDEVRDLSLGLIDLGLARGGAVAIQGNNRPRWLFAELAAQAAGAAVIALDPLAAPEPALSLDSLARSGASFVILEDRARWSELPAALDRLPQLKVIHWNRRGPREKRHQRLFSFESVQERGRAQNALQPGLWAESVERGRSDDLAIKIVAADGGAERSALSFRELLSIADGLFDLAAHPQGSELVSFVPLADAGEQALCVGAALARGYIVNFPEEPETQLADLREIGPALVAAPPSFWRALRLRVLKGIAGTTPLKRFLFERCFSMGSELEALRAAGRSASFGGRARGVAARLILFRALLDRLGLSRLRAAAMVGDSVGLVDTEDAEVLRFFRAIGVSLAHVAGTPARLRGAA